MNLVNIRNYIIILAALIALVVGITTLLYFYNQILDTVFVEHKAIQNDENLINFFEKTFGLAVTILVSSVALVIALLSVRIMRQQTELIRHQNELSEQQVILNKRQIDLDLRFRAKDYFEQNYIGSIQVYGLVNSIFYSFSKIVKYQNTDGLYYDISRDPDFSKEDQGCLDLEAGNLKEHEQAYNNNVDPSYRQIISDAEQLLRLMMLKSANRNFVDILNYCSSGTLKDAKEYISIFNSWNSTIKLPEKIDTYGSRSLDMDDYGRSLPIIDNVAVYLSLTDGNIIRQVSQLASILHSSTMYDDNDHFEARENISFKVLPHIILATLILYNPDFISEEDQEFNDTKFPDYIKEIIAARLPQYKFMFYQEGKPIYPGFASEIQTLITSNSVKAN